MNLPGAPLTELDLAKLAKCGITRDLADQALLRRVTSQEGATLVGRNGSADYAGIIFPYTWPGEASVRDYRLRRDKPEIEYKDGQARERAKYLSPPGKGNMLYLVPGSAPEWLGDPAMPAVITEGEKKGIALFNCAWGGLGDSAEAPRFLPIGLPGVWNWRGSTGKTNGPDGDRRDVKGVVPDLGRIQWKGRKVTILFDRNVTDNGSVQAARRELTKELQRRGAEIFWFTWPANTPAEVNGIDDLIGVWGNERALKVLGDAQPTRPTSDHQKRSEREFEAVGDDRYRLKLPRIGVEFEVDRLRRERHELVGELSVRCVLPGARTFDGSLSTADFNLSSARARSERAKLLSERSNARDLDWNGIVEEFCHRVLTADRAGEPAIDLRELPRPNRQQDVIDVDGLTLPRLHPSAIFGDGGAVKSYFALHFAAELAKRNVAVGLFDWELVGDDHRDRLERLCGDDMPRIHYVRCDRPLTSEVDRLRRIVHENGIEYAVFDSVAFAADGPPESAEVAARYFRAVRQIGCGSLHVAHISKAENADQKPFGSVFWHNGFRCSWFAQRADDSQDGSVLRLGLFNRKANLGPLRPPVGLTVTFTEDRTTFRRSDVAGNPELAAKLTVAQRMKHLLRGGSKTVAAIAEELEIDVNTVTQTVNRYAKKGRLFIVLGGENTNRRIGLVAS